MRSLCFGSIFACILKIKPVSFSSSGFTTLELAFTGLGRGAIFIKISSISWMPKLFTALPKNTGATFASR